jgi:flagellar basal-body rod modification protein FlgD
MQIPGSIPAATAADNPASGTENNGQNSSMITANDFLTLLVTELKNQDPTANTDPNAYVDQLVQVNSLQQLIQINQNTNTTTPSS